MVTVLAERFREVISGHFTRRSSRVWWALLGLFFLGQIVATVVGSLPIGPKIAPDSGRYIAGGVTFPHIDKVQFGYLGYCFVMWIDTLVEAHQWLVVVLQSVVAIVAARFLWDLAKSYAGHFAGFIAAFIYLINPLTATWTRYVLTETFFFGSTVLLFWGLDRWLGPRREVTVVLFLGIAGTITMRPNGVIMIPALVATLILVSPWRKFLRVTGAALAFVFVGLAVSMLPTFESGGGGPRNSFVQRSARGEVLWNDPEWSIGMPPVSPDATSNGDYVKYILEHPVDMARLGVARLGAELIQIRPQRGDAYNVVTAFVMFVFFALFAMGVKLLKRTPVVRSVMLISVPYMGLIMITWAIQEGRFGWWFMTTWIPVVAVAVDRLAARDELSCAPRPGP